MNINSTPDQAAPHNPNPNNQNSFQDLTGDGTPAATQERQSDSQNQDKKPAVTVLTALECPGKADIVETYDDSDDEIQERQSDSQNQDRKPAVRVWTALECLRNADIVQTYDDSDDEIPNSRENTASDGTLAQNQGVDDPVSTSTPSSQVIEVRLSPVDLTPEAESEIFNPNSPDVTEENQSDSERQSNQDLYFSSNYSDMVQLIDSSDEENEQQETETLKRILNLPKPILRKNPDLMSTLIPHRNNS